MARRVLGYDRTVGEALVLVVDDDPAVGEVLGTLIEQDLPHVETRYVRDAAAALAELAARAVDVVITDLRMPGVDGMELLARIKRDHRDLPVVMMTAHATVKAAIEANRRGAADFVLKPFDRDEIRFVVDKALARARHAERAPSPTPGPFVGAGAAMTEVARRIAKAASSNEPVLLLGENGTGKELAARAIHDRSRRKSGPFVALNCAAFPETLIESELFGYKKGAFNGASADKPGQIELADGGTLFLDEIGEISHAVQVKLLRTINKPAEKWTLTRLGATRPIDVDVRLVCATNRNLPAMAEHGEYRKDFFERIQGIPIVLPPLRDRREEIAPLARHFCARASDGAVTLDADAIAQLEVQAWTGNVRQLENFVRRLVVLAERERIAASDVEREIACSQALAASASATGALKPAAVALRELTPDEEKARIVAALEKTGGNITRAAEALEIARRTLHKKLDAYGLR